MVWHQISFILEFYHQLDCVLVRYGMTRLCLYSLPFRFLFLDRLSIYCGIDVSVIGQKSVDLSLLH